MELLSAQNIEKRYANHLALDNVSIAVKEGSIFGLLGPNGAGKTSLIRIINQITGPDKGQLHFMGKPMQMDDVYKIGYLPEERGLYKKMKVGEQALYLARLKGLSKRDATKKLRYWFEKFEMLPWWNKKVEELSKGMQQKIQFVVTVLHEPQLLIFDEPFSGFDPINVNLLKQEILAQKEKGTTIIFSTHNMASVEELCDDISLINKSKVILSGSVNNIKQNYKQNLYQISYSGSTEKVGQILQEGYEVIEKQQNHEIQSVTVRMLEPAVDNRLLNQLLPHVHIISFAELLPSMNDIFIGVVQGGYHPSFDL